MCFSDGKTWLISEVLFDFSKFDLAFLARVIYFRSRRLITSLARAFLRQRREPSAAGAAREMRWLVAAAAAAATGGSTPCAFSQPFCSGFRKVGHHFQVPRFEDKGSFDLVKYSRRPTFSFVSCASAKHFDSVNRCKSISVLRGLRRNFVSLDVQIGQNLSLSMLIFR